MRALGAFLRGDAVLIALVLTVPLLIVLTDGTLLPGFAPLPAYVRALALQVGVNLVVVIGLLLINGLCGQLSLGHAGFMALGAYSAALLTKAYGAQPHTVTGTFLMVAGMLLGGLVAAAAGWLIGKPTFRLRGDYLAIVTLAFAEIIGALLRASDELAPLAGQVWPAAGELLAQVRGPRGIIAIPALADPWLVFFTVLAAVLTARNFIFSTHGRACRALCDDELAAQTLGIDTARYATLAFCAAAFWAGVGGALYAHLFGFIDPNSFSFLKTIDYLIYLYVGGMHSFSGVLAATTGLTLLPEALRALDLAQWRMVAYPLILIVLMLCKPAGLFGRREWRLLLPPALRRREPRA